MASSSKVGNTAAAAAVLAATMSSQENIDTMAARSFNNLIEKAAERQGGSDVVTIQNIQEVINEKINIDKDPEKTLLQKKYDDYQDPPFDMVEAQMLENKITEAYTHEQNLRDKTIDIELFSRDRDGTLAQDLRGGLFRGTGFENIFAMEPAPQDIDVFRAQLEDWTRRVPTNDPLGAPRPDADVEAEILQRVQRVNDLLNRLADWQNAYRELGTLTRAVDPTLAPNLFTRSRENFLDPRTFPKSDRHKVDRKNKIFTAGKISYYDHPILGKTVLKFTGDVNWKRLVKDCTVRDDSMKILNIVESIKKLLEAAEKRGFTKDENLKEFMYQFLLEHFSHSASLIENEPDPDEVWKCLLSKHRPDQNYKRARYSMSKMTRSARVPIDEFAEVYISRNKKVCYHELNAVERANKECLTLAYKQADKIAMFGLLEYTLPEIREVLHPQLTQAFMKQKVEPMEQYIKKLYDMEQVMLPKALKKDPKLYFKPKPKVQTAISDSTRGYNVDVFTLGNLESNFAKQLTVRSHSASTNRSSNTNGSKNSTKAKISAKAKGKHSKDGKSKPKKSTSGDRKGRDKRRSQKSKDKRSVTPNSNKTSSRSNSKSSVTSYLSGLSGLTPGTSNRSSSIGSAGTGLSANSMQSGKSSVSKTSAESDSTNPYKDPKMIKFMEERDVKCLKCFNLGEKLQKIPPNHDREMECFKYKGPLAKKNCPKCNKGFHYIPSGPHKQDCKYEVIVKNMRSKMQNANKTNKDDNRLRRGPDGQLTSKPRRSDSGSRVSISKEDWARVQKLRSKVKKQKEKRMK